MSLKLVYIDDELDLCEIFDALFASEMVSVRTFTDPREGVQAIASDRPDVLFIDYRLPGVSGIELARGIDPSIPKYLVTGEINIEAQANFLGIIAKPIDVDKVSQIIDGHRTKSA